MSEHPAEPAGDVPASFERAPYLPGMMERDPEADAILDGLLDPAWAERHHWLNALVGMLDSAFRLTDQEQYFVADIVSKLLDFLDIPFRGMPASLPNAVAIEVESGQFALQLSSPRETGIDRPVRPAVVSDIVVSVEAWRTALMQLLVSAYPELSGEERVMTAQVFDQLLTAIGVPDRLACFFPEEVVRAYRTHDLLGA